MIPTHPTAHPATPAAHSVAEPTGGTILVVDDQQLNRTLLAAQLRGEGHRVLQATHGREALAVLGTQPVDVVLLDLIMPEMDGYELLTVFEADARLRHIPVIVISSVDELQSAVRCIEMGAADHLSRPVNPVLLRARIHATLAAKRLHDQEVAYKEAVNQLTAAAAELETGHYAPERLATVAERPDALGHLAQVFGRMADEVRARERQLAQESAFKTALIGRISHELRSPFVSAGFTVQLLQRYAERGMVAELVDELPALAQQLTAGRQMIDGVVAYAALASRLSQTQRAPTDVAAMLAKLRPAVDALARAREIALHWEIAPLPPVTLDREQIGEAIHHLLLNALKFTPSGGSVWVSCVGLDEHLVLTVADTGPGMELAQMDRLWEAFAQDSDEVRRGVAGLGLGLALVKCVVDAHRGNVLAMSAPGEGTIMGFRIPLAAA